MNFKQNKEKKEEKASLHLDIYTTQLKKLINQLNENKLVSFNSDIKNKMSHTKHFRARMEEIENTYNNADIESGDEEARKERVEA